MHDFLKEIAEANDWQFIYGRSDYQNLYDEIETGKTLLYVEPIQSDGKFSDAGNETVTYSGRFLLVVSSDVDEEYEVKYEQYIKPLYENERVIIKNAFACSDYQLNLFRTVEVINYFDNNVDGLLITYSATLID